MAVIVALLAATTPISSAESKLEELDPPPSTPIDASIVLAVVRPPSPTLLAVVVGKSHAEEQREREEAEKAAKAAELAAKQAAAAKLAAEKEAERIKHTAAQKKLAETHPEQKQAESVRIIGYSREQCVIYVQRMRGDRAAQGYAGDLKPQGYEPRVGAVALERNYGHVSLVISIEGDYLVLHDANWIVGAITERRVYKSTQRGYIY